VRRRILFILLFALALALIVLIARHDEGTIAGLAANDFGALV
jgi:hypothetical protein